MKTKVDKNAAESKPKRVYNHLDFTKKLEVIRKLENGSSKADLARQYKTSETSIYRTWLKRDDIKKQAAEMAPKSMSKISRKRSPNKERMERLLLQWFEDCFDKRIPVNRELLMARADTLFKVISKNHPEPNEPMEGDDEGATIKKETFKATRGQFEGFKSRTGIHNLQIQGEASSADTAAAAKFPEILEKIKHEGGYTDDQIFNADETALLWKALIRKTYVPEGQKHFSGYKAAKERLTVLLGGNASGSMKLRPLVIHRSENPRAFKNVQKSGLPVIWKANKKAWMTQTIFRDWFHNYFCVEVERFCKFKKIPFKALLLLDNAPGHPLDIKHPNVRIEYLPANTTSVLQPMDMGIIATFKAYYLRETYEQALLASEPNNPRRIELPQFFKQLDVLRAVENIARAWNKVTEHNLRSMWKQAMPNRDKLFNENIENSVENSDDFNENVTQEIISIGSNLQLQNIDKDSVNDFIGPMGSALTDEELIEMENMSQVEESDDEDTEADPETESIQIPKITEAIDLVKQAIEIFKEFDPVDKRRVGVTLSLDSAIKPYENMLLEKASTSKQSKIESFFAKKN